VLSLILLGSAAGPPLPGQTQSLEAWESKTFEKQPPDRVMEAAGITPGLVIGEVGAGKGRFTLHLARQVGPTGRVLANDIDAEGLAVIRDRCQRAGIDNVETILGKENDASFPDGELDMVFMVWTYHFFDQPVVMLRSLIPALKPGATVVLVEPDPERGPGGSEHGVSAKRMQKEAAEAGFELLRTETFLAEDLIFVLRLREQ
jgi:ubiquinone/menaquinone biosynthesis C-methylase UbiE